MEFYRIGTDLYGGNIIRMLGSPLVIQPGPVHGEAQPGSVNGETQPGSAYGEIRLLRSPISLHCEDQRHFMS
jgi:hypothetical protein